jgi:hypothetical protein
VLHLRKRQNRDHRPSVRATRDRQILATGEIFIDLPDNLPAELAMAMQRTQPLEFDARAPLRCPS